MSSTEKDDAGSQSRYWWIGVGLITLIGAALRAPGMFTEFWLDEIWSWILAWEQARSAPDILLRVYSDNNHWLNTLFIRAMGREPWWGYRILSFACGVLLVPVVALIGKLYGGGVGVVASAMAAVCYLLVHYSSEARGYAPATFFALVCFYLMQLPLRGGRRRWWYPVLFGIAAALGFLSHLTFLYVYVALVVWWFAARAHRPLRWRAMARELVAWQIFPTSFLLSLYLVNVRHIGQIGVGQERPFTEGLKELAMWVLGAPRTPNFAFGVGAVGACLFCWGIIALCRRGARDWVFYCAAVVLLPAAALLFRPPEVFYPRYVEVSVPFLLLVLALGLCDLLLLFDKIWIRGLAGVLIASFAVGNGVWMARFYSAGRGHYREAMQYISAETPGPIVRVGTDQDFRNGLVLWFYGTHYPTSKPFRYAPDMGRQGTPPQWIIAHRFEGEPPPPEVTAVGNVVYRREKQFPSAGASGWTWWVYRAVGTRTTDNK
jgi:hypothetical protein